MTSFVKKYKFDLALILVLVAVGQLAFLFMSDRFMTPKYEGRVYATTAIGYKEGVNLHTLNEGAHYFGQTMIGWSKFPSFSKQIRSYANLPLDSDINVRMQERQNVIFTVSSAEPMVQEQLEKMAEFMQNKIDLYNKASQTDLELTNLDYEVITIQKGYAYGAVVALLAMGLLGLGVGFVRREMFQS